MRVKFVVNRTVKDAEGLTYEKGKVYEMSEGSADHWIRRRVAVVHTGRGRPAQAQPEQRTAEEVEPLKIAEPEPNDGDAPAAAPNDPMASADIKQTRSNFPAV